MREQPIKAATEPEYALRADFYGFLAALLTRPPHKDILDRVAALKGDGSELGQAVDVLARVAGATAPKAAEREFNRLFIGIGRGELVPYASFYLTGFLHEKPLAVLRGDMAALGIARAPDVYEPEDNIGSLCEMMAGMIRGDFGAPVPLRRQREFFNRHLRPWARHFFTDLEGAKHSVLYAPVGTLGRLFTEIETESYRMAGEDAA